MEILFETSSHGEINYYNINIKAYYKQMQSSFAENSKFLRSGNEAFEWLQLQILRFETKREKAVTHLPTLSIVLFLQLIAMRNLVSNSHVEFVRQLCSSWHDREGNTSCKKARCFFSLLHLIDFELSSLWNQMQTGYLKAHSSISWYCSILFPVLVCSFVKCYNFGFSFYLFCLCSCMKLDFNDLCNIYP